MKQKMPGARRLHFLVIVFCTLLLTAFFACQNSVALDEALAYALIDAVFLAIVLYMLESGRLRRAIGASAASRYERISFCYGAFCALFAGFYFGCARAFFERRFKRGDWDWLKRVFVRAA